MEDQTPLTDDEGPRPRYQWRRDPHAEHIFAGWDGERQFGRLARAMNDASLWDWNLTCLHGVKDISRLDGWSGREVGARRAARACEDAYDAAMAGKLFGMTQQDVADILADEEFMRKRRAGLI